MARRSRFAGSYGGSPGGFSGYDIGPSGSAPDLSSIVASIMALFGGSTGSAGSAGSAPMNVLGGPPDFSGGPPPGPSQQPPGVSGGPFNLGPKGSYTNGRWAGLAPGQFDSGGRRVIGPDEVYNPQVIYNATGEVIGRNSEPTRWTPTTARAWWDNWFKNPTPMYNEPDLPGPLVLSPDEVLAARRINTRIGPDPAMAQGQNAGYRPGDTSLNNSYDVLGYLNDLLAQQKAGTYKSVNPLVAGRPDEATLNLQELTRNIEAAQATIAQNKWIYDIGLQQQAAAGGPLPAPAPAPAPAPTTATTAVSKATLDTLANYIKNLSAVANPTAVQKQKLADYQARYAAYAAR